MKKYMGQYKANYKVIKWKLISLTEKCILKNKMHNWKSIIFT